MILQEHKDRHILLHRYFDELVADFIYHTGLRPSEQTVLDMMIWSHRQSQSPTTTDQIHIEEVKDETPLSS